MTGNKAMRDRIEETDPLKGGSLQHLAVDMEAMEVLHSVFEDMAKAQSDIEKLVRHQAKRIHALEGLQVLVKRLLNNEEGIALDEDGSRLPSRIVRKQDFDYLERFMEELEDAQDT